MPFLPMTFSLLGGVLMITDVIPEPLGWALIAVGVLFTSGLCLRRRSAQTGLDDKA